MAEIISTKQPTTEFICPVHGNIGDEWSNKSISIEDGRLHCVLCIRDLLAKQLPVVEKRERE